MISGYEHHSNILPWKEIGAQVVEIRESSITGAVDLNHLEDVLATNRHRSTLIGSFSAGSNVSGVCSNVPALATLLHKYGAIACFDYACVAPYVPIRMNPVGNKEDGDMGLSYIDAVFISPHKFVGGVGSSGLLVAKKSILTRQVPVSPGGGTVLYVTSDKQA